MFFYNSFKRRTKSDYAKLFSRGLGEKESVNTEYPWFYLRVFGVLALAYCVYAVIASIIPTASDRVTFYFVGGAFLDIALLVLLFELYPYNDISLPALCLVLIIGGAVSSFFSSFMYSFHRDDILLRGWRLAVIAGVGEEIAKAIPAVLCIIILNKKKIPAAGFLIGFAVGTWFSLTENAGYIYSAGGTAMKVLTATARAFGAPFSHASWTALICWAFCKFKKPFINLKFYGVVLFCMAMHFCIDMPLNDYIILLFAEAAVCGLSTFIFAAAVFLKERKNALPQVRRVSDAVPFTLSHKADITAGAFAAVFCAMLLVLASVFKTYSYDKTYFATKEDFLLFAHNGYVIAPDYEREYDENYDNYSEYYEYDEEYGQKVLKNAEQYVTENDITYIYFYTLQRDFSSVTEDDGEAEENSEGGENEDETTERTLKIMRIDVIITVDGEEQRYFPVTYMLDGNSITLYRINADFSGGVQFEDGKYVYFTTNNTPDVPSFITLGVCVAVAAAGITTYCVMKKKAKKLG